MSFLTLLEVICDVCSFFVQTLQPAKRVYAQFVGRQRCKKERPSSTNLSLCATRRVHQLAAILLRRWQAEEIAKTLFPCASRITIKHNVPSLRAEMLVARNLAGRHQHRIAFVLHEEHQSDAFLGLTN